MTAMPKYALAAIVWMLSIAGQGHASTVEALSGEQNTLSPYGEPFRCNLRLDGVIVPGDLAKLAAARAKVSDLTVRRLGSNAGMAEVSNSRSPVLCLNSPGGNYVEGIRIAQFLMAVASDHEVTTYDENGAECYTACAFIFLAGVANDRGGETWPARFLHVGGRLGFHAPYIDASILEDRTYSRSEIADMYQLAISSVMVASRLFEVRASGGQWVNQNNRPWVSPSLFIEMFRKGANELFLIDTVEKAGRWGVGLVGTKAPNVLSADILRQACDNVDAWENDREGYKSPVYERLPSSHASSKYFSRLPGAFIFWINGMRRNYYCLAKRRVGPESRVDGLTVKLVQNVYELNPAATTFDGYAVPLWAGAFSPYTPLLSLLRP